MAKARVGLYSTKGDTLVRSHKFCPKCGNGIFLAEHDNRRACGKCGYSETKAPAAAPAPKPTGGKAKAPKSPTASAPRAPTA